MWTKSFSKFYPGIKAKDVWNIWTDINNWPKWHDDLEYCKMEGPFEVDNHFMLKPKRVKAVRIVLTDIKEGKEFTDCTSFFGAKMYDTHKVEETPDGVWLTNTLIVTGPLKWLWTKLVAQNIADTVPEETEALIALAKNHA